MDQTTWQKYDLLHQLGNIGSEISRALTWEQNRNEENRSQAIRRSLDLIDMTIKTLKNSNQIKELTRLRELMIDQLIKRNYYDVNLNILRNYCLEFASAIRK